MTNTTLNPDGTLEATDARFTVKQAVLARLKPSYTLWYADYRDGFENVKTIAELYKTGGQSFYDDDMDDGLYEGRAEMARQYLDDELTDEENEILEGTDEYYELRDEIINRDDSNPLKDILRNTSKQWMYSHIGNDVETTLGKDEEERAAIHKQVRDQLGIPDGGYEKEIAELCENATYGGELVVLYCDDVDDLILKKDEIKTLKFKDPMVCIMDRCNGSGYDVEFKGLNLEIPREYDENTGRGGVRFDNGGNGYGYADDVCGLCQDSYIGRLNFGY